MPPITRPQNTPLSTPRNMGCSFNCNVGSIVSEAGHLDHCRRIWACIAQCPLGITPFLKRVSAVLLLIDNYDSFTYNLAHYLGELGREVAVRRNDALNVQEAMGMRPEGIVLSPGPCDPDRAGICLAMAAAAADARLPLLGVCLGHQVIGQDLWRTCGACQRNCPRQTGKD